MTPKQLYLTPIQRVIAWRLALVPLTTTAEMLWTVYGDREPDGADSVLKAHVSYLRAKLRPYGIEIHGWRGMGYAATERSRLLDILADEIERNTPPTLAPVHRTTHKTVAARYNLRVG